MRPSDYHSLDDFIDAALKSEPIRRAPIDLQRSIQNRVERLAQVQRERRSFRMRVAAAGGAFALLAIVVTVALTAGGLPHALASFVPGAMGYYDSFAVTAGRWVMPGLLTAFVTLTAVVAGAVLAENRTLRLRRNTA